MSTGKRIVILARDSASSRILYHAVRQFCKVELIVVEKDLDLVQKARSRMKLMGVWKGFGQLLFMWGIVPLLKLISTKRREQIYQKYDLQEEIFPAALRCDVESVNSDIVIDKIKKIAPELVVVSGTRIIRKRLLKEVTCPFLNIHAGITPAYRGVHGGYRALFMDEPENFGTTIHYIDDGVDTGAVITQIRVQPERQDNFTTYPLLQLGVALAPLKEILESYPDLKCSEVKENQIGKQWYHPTLCEYIAGAFRGTL